MSRVRAWLRRIHDWMGGVPPYKRRQARYRKRDNDPAPTTRFRMQSAWKARSADDPLPGSQTTMSGTFCPCLGSCFAPSGSPDTWAELLHAERALADDLADALAKVWDSVTNQFATFGVVPKSAEVERVLARYREARQR